MRRHLPQTTRHQPYALRAFTAMNATPEAPTMASAESPAESETQTGATADDEPVVAPQAAGREARLTIQAMDLHTAGEPLRLIRTASRTCP